MGMGKQAPSEFVTVNNELTQEEDDEASRSARTDQRSRPHESR